MPSATVPHQALYRRWRAQTFARIVGQEAVVATLRNGVRTGRLAHGLLFVGPRGTGKTSLARIVAKAVNCLAPVDGEPCDACEPCTAIREGRALDVVELDAASNNRVDDMRELLPRVYTGPADLRRKVFIIDEVQRIKEGWDVLLKVLEEPPADVLFIFCTTNPAQIRPAVLSRLQRYAFRPLTVPEIAGKLRTILAAEEVAADEAAIELVAELAAGGMRDAESMLDQLLSAGVERLTADAVRDLLGLADAAAVDGFLEALVRHDALAGIAVLEACQTGGRDLSAFVDQLIARLHTAIVSSLTGRSGAAEAKASLLEGAPPLTLTRLARRVGALDSSRGAADPRFGLELILLEEAASSFPASAPAPVAIGPSTDLETASLGPVGAGREPRRSSAPAPRSDGQPFEATVPTPVPDLAEERRAPSAGAVGGPPPAAGPLLPARPASEDSFDRLRRGWPTLVAELGRNPALRPLVAACRPVEIRERIVVLGFPEEQAFMRDIAERKKPALEEGVAKVLGSGFGVRCVLANLDGLEPLPASGEDDDLVASFKEIFAGDLADVVEIS